MNEDKCTFGLGPDGIKAQERVAKINYCKEVLKMTYKEAKLVCPPDEFMWRQRRLNEATAHMLLMIIGMEEEEDE